MSKRLIVRILKRIIVVGITSGIVALALMGLKYFEKSNPVSNTVEGVNIVAVASVFGTVFILMLVVVLILNNRRKNLKTNISREKKEKVGYVKIWDWMGWIIVVVIISGVFVFVFVAPKYFKNKGGVKTGSELSIHASYTWKKKSHQYGHDPNQRFGGPYDVVITRDDPVENNDSSFCFTLHGDKSLAHFYGKKKKNGVIEGWWEQKTPRSSGTWNLKKDKDNPNLYTGIITDRYLPEGVDAELRLKY